MRAERSVMEEIPIGRWDSVPFRGQEAPYHACPKLVFPLLAVNQCFLTVEFSPAIVPVSPHEAGYFSPLILAEHGLDIEHRRPIIRIQRRYQNPLPLIAGIRGKERFLASIS